MRSAIVVLLSFPFVVSADQVILSNGDTLTGSIVKKDGDKLTMKTEFLGEVSMPWAAVRSLRSDAELTVVLPGVESVRGKVTTAGANLEVATAAGPRTAPMGGISAVRNEPEQRAFERLEHPRLLELWTGYFDLGLALARGNAHTTSLTMAFNASRVTRTSKLTTYFNQIYGTARLNNVETSTASAVRGGWSFNRNVSNRFFVNVFNDYEHDRFQNLDLRFVLGGGGGYNAIKRDRLRLDVLAGGDYERENFGSGIHRNSAEASFGNELLYKVSGVTTLNQSFRFFSNLTDTGQYRVNFDLGAVTTLKKWLGWQVTASDRFLSNPVFGRQRNDLLLSTGFRVSFAK